MRVILSPARNIRPATPEGLGGLAGLGGLEGQKTSRPLFIREAALLVAELLRRDLWELETIFDLDSEKTLEMFVHYRQFRSRQTGTPALFSYYGAAFRNMAPRDFDAAERVFASKTLRILSALYGLLRPMDGVLPHRLGLGREFMPGGQTLYAFWGDKLYQALFDTRETVVNLASSEYAKLVTPYLSPTDRIVNCRFLIQRQDGARGTVATVRAARGQMARYIVKHKITEPEGLKEFDWDGYRFVEGLSHAGEYVFIRPAEISARLPEYQNRP